MIGDARWLQDCRYRYEFYVEQEVKRSRIPRPFEPFAAARLFDKLTTTYRFLDVLRRMDLEWETPNCDLAIIGAGHCGPRDLVRYMTAVTDHIDRALKALQERDAKAHKLVIRFFKSSRWEYARYGLTPEEGHVKVEDAKIMLFGLLTRGAEVEV